MKNLTKVLGVAAVMASSLMAVPCFALDYEAKPVMWVLQAPIRLVGGLSGALVSGVYTGPANHGYGGFVKTEDQWAEKFGDQKGMGQRVAAVPMGSAGMVVGSGYGMLSGVKNGWRQGWDKPFSRWSYLNTYEEGK